MRCFWMSSGAAAALPLTVGALVTAVGALPSVVGCKGKDEARASSAAPAASIAPSTSSAASIAFPIPSGDVASVLNPMNLPVYDGAKGSIEGTVLVAGPPAPDVPGLDVKQCRAALDTYGKAFREGERRADGLRPLADAIVAVTGYSGAYVAENRPVKRVTITARCAYPLRTIDLTFGQRLEIDNDSKVPFGPYLEGASQVAVMVAPPEHNGEPVKIYPPQAGYFALKDRLLPFVRGDVYVLRHPLHAVSDVGGHYRIDGVPVGKLHVGARLAAVGSEAQKEVDVRANVVETVDLVLTYAPADAGPAVPSGAGKRIVIH